MILFLMLLGILTIIGVLVIAVVETRRMDMGKVVVAETKRPDMEGTVMEPRQKYAGLWIRFCAHIIDWFLIGMVGGILPTIMVSITGWELKEIGRTSLTVGAVVFIILCSWLYFALMQSSSKQATLGKMLGKIIVTDVDGNRVLFWRASLRFFIKIICLFLLGPFNFITVFFTKKKQTLYDLFAGCLVLKKLL